jgi:hypothetical protein
MSPSEGEVTPGLDRTCWSSFSLVVVGEAQDRPFLPASAGSEKRHARGRISDAASPQPQEPQKSRIELCANPALRSAAIVGPAGTGRTTVLLD